MQRNELLENLNAYLAVDSYDDYCPNGLQVSGEVEIKRLISGVTICQDLIEQAIKHQADAILVHHGLFWRGDGYRLEGIKRQRIAKLLEHNINLIAYHLPLDYHSEIGNNILFANHLDIKVLDRSNPYFIGEFNQPESAAKCTAKLTDICQRQPLLISNNNRSINTVAWCVGKAPDFIEEAAALGVDAYITGEINEAAVHLALELGIHLFVAGHYATERLGIQALGEYVSNKFQIDHEFIELVNII